MHRLVRDLLHNELALTEPERPAELHLRAAGWYTDAGDVAQAAEHLIAAKDWDRLDDFIHQHVRALWEQAQFESVLPWIQAIPIGMRRARVGLRLTEAAVQLLAGRPDACAATIKDVELDGQLTEAEQVIADAVFVCLVEVTPPTSTIIQRGDRALSALRRLPAEGFPDLLPGIDHAATSCLLRFSSAKARLHTGAPHALEFALAATDTPPSTPVVYRVQAAATTELIGAFAHDPAAEVGAARAEALAAELLAPQSPAPGTATLALAVAARDRGNLDEAGTLLEPALAQAIRWRRWPLATLMLAELALVDLARGAPHQALRHLDRGARMTTTPLTSFVADRYEAISALAWAALGERREPHRNRPHGYNRRAGWELSLVEVVLAIEADRPSDGAAAVASWPIQTEPMGMLERDLATALVERASGDGTSARHRINVLLDRAEDTGLLGPFLLGGRPTVNLLAEVARDRLTPHTEIVLTAARRAAGDRRERPHQLSDRELEVVNLLPSRLSNAEMAQALFVSTNTVKTHLKHIYQKLGAVNRDEAIRRARDVGLL